MFVKNLNNFKNLDTFNLLFKLRTRQAVSFFLSVNMSVDYNCFWFKYNKMANWFFIKFCHFNKFNLKIILIRTHILTNYLNNKHFFFLKWQPYIEECNIIIDELPQLRANHIIAAHQCRTIASPVCPLRRRWFYILYPLLARVKGQKPNIRHFHQRQMCCKCHTPLCHVPRAIIKMTHPKSNGKIELPKIIIFYFQ